MEEDAFFNHFHAVEEMLPKDNIAIVMTDLNVKVGSGTPCWDMW